MHSVTSTVTRSRTKDLFSLFLCTRILLASLAHPIIERRANTKKYSHLYSEYVSKTDQLIKLVTVTAPETQKSTLYYKREETIRRCIRGAFRGASGSRLSGWWGHQIDIITLSKHNLTKFVVLKGQPGLFPVKQLTCDFNKLHVQLQTFHTMEKVTNYFPSIEFFFKSKTVGKKSI